MNDNNAHSYSEGDGVSPLDGYKYIGSVNEFPIDKDMQIRKVPAEINACLSAGHELGFTHTRMGYHKTWCPTCKIWWDMDSGD